LSTGLPAAWVGWPLILARVHFDSILVSWLWIVAPIQSLARLGLPAGAADLIGSFLSFLLSVAGTVLFYGMYLA
jgi:hypothetical protein